jgi:hypothetical protein
MPVIHDDAGNVVQGGAKTPLSGSFTGTGTSSTISHIRGDYNTSIWGTFVGTVQLQRSFDDGSTWLEVAEYTSGAESVGKEPEKGVLYRFECTAFTSGTINYRMAQ